MNKKLNNIFTWTLLSTTFFTGLTFIGLQQENTSSQRSIASSTQDGEEFVLEMKNLHLNEETEQLDKLENSYLRITLGDEQIIEHFKDNPFKLFKGETKDLNLLVNVNPNSITNDELKLKIEIMNKGQFFDTATVRCSFSSKKLSLYNRGYECYLPNETKALLSYRVARKKDIKLKDALQLSQR